MKERLKGRGVRRGLAAAGLAAVAVAVAALALSGGSAEQPAAAEASAAGTGTVERRTLAEQLTVGGTIGYAGETTVLARLSGTVTALPAIGDVIRRSEQLYALAGKPVLLMYGGVPAYRTLGEGVSAGEDVEQLEENLAALGYEPGTVDEEFTATTAAAVGAWQEDLGLEASGEVELGRVAFLPGPRRVTEVEATLGEALGSGGGGGLATAPADEGGTTLVAYEPSVKGGVEPVPGEPEPQEEEREPSPEPERGPEPKPEPETPAPEPVAPQREAPATAAPSQAEAGPEGAAGAEPEPEPASVPVLRTSSTRRVVSVGLDPDQQSLAHRGQRVAVLLAGGAEATGVVRRIAAAQAAGEEGPGEESEPGVEVTVSIPGQAGAPAPDGSAVSVRFTQRVRRDVLSVPLTALLAIGGERFAVIAIEAGSQRRIEVTPGLAADGYVEVAGRGLREGMRVEVGG